MKTINTDAGVVSATAILDGQTGQPITQASPLPARPPRYDLMFTNKTVDENIVSGQGELGDIFIEASASGGVIIYDNTSAAGTVLFSHTFTAAFTGRIGVTRGKYFSNGLFIDIVGTAKVSGEYRLR